MGRCQTYSDGQCDPRRTGNVESYADGPVTCGGKLSSKESYGGVPEELRSQSRSGTYCSARTAPVWPARTALRARVVRSHT